MEKNLRLKRILKIIAKTLWIVILAGLPSVFVGFSEYRTKGPAEVLLSDKGHALYPVVVSSYASERTHKVAKDLADYLSRITGGDFEIKTGDGMNGIAVGSYKDFPDAGLENLFDPNNLTRRDEYLLRTHENGVYLVGATDLAAQHAVWDFLYRTGYRQFFPTDTWEYIPQEPDLSIELNDFEKPDFYNRNGPRISPYSDNKLWHRWHDRNRITSSFEVNTGHSYNSIIDRNKKAFDEHPEFLALVDGMRGGGRGDKFCISNKDLRNLVIEDARNRIRENPELMSISMDPSDGGDWCECEACAEMGSVSDRVIILANEVAEAINNMGYGEKYVGTYAYNQHSPPPNIDVHPKVIVSIATSYIRGGYTFEELIKGWSKHANMIGIREYYGPFVWYQGMPRKARGGNVNYLVEKLPYFYENGARFMNACSGNSWPANGVGLYLSARLLWDIKAAEKADDIVNDFLEKMFGEAREPMSKFYHMIALDYDTPRTNEDLLACMYGYLKEAYGVTDDPKVHIRLDELTLYTRYVELWFSFQNAKEQVDREKAAQDVFRHAYRMQSRMMVPVKDLYIYLRRPNVAINIPEAADPGNLVVGSPLENMEPWKSNRLFSNKEINNYIENGIESYKKDEIKFDIVSFSEDLVPAAQKLNLREVPMGNMGDDGKFRGRHKMLTWLQPDNKQLTITVTGGFIYRDRGNIRFMLFSPKEALVEPVDTDESVPPDGKVYNVTLKSPYDGQHELEWNDGEDRTQLEWVEGHPMTVKADMENPARFGDNSRLYFYVPKGTTTVGGYADNNNFQMFDGSGSKVLDLRDTEGGEGYFSVVVPKNQDGTLWELQCNNVTIRLMTVPPYLARNEKELLLPKEVIEADMLKR